MKIQIETDSQEEFELKRLDLIKAIAGDSYIVKADPTDRATSRTPKKPFYRSQLEAMKYWDSKFEAAIDDIKAQIDEIIR